MSDKNIFGDTNIIGDLEVTGSIINSALDNLITPIKQYGVQWEQASDTVSRIGDSATFTRSDFDFISPYKDIRRCMVNDDLSINYYIDASDPTKIGQVVNFDDYTTGGNADYTGTHGQVMVEIPKFYWKLDNSGSTYRWYISAVKSSGFVTHPAFVTNGVEKDYIYFSAFEGNVDSGVMRSISGVQPSTDTNVTGGTIVDFRGYAQARGTGWQMQTYWGTHALQLLYLIEYADFDTQTTIGRGVVDLASGTVNESINTGGTISLGNASGMASGTNGQVSISYRGVENFWGNIYKFVDGLNINDNVAYVSNENFASDVFSGDYKEIGLLHNANSYPTDVYFPHFLATAGGGSSTTYLHDYYYQNSEQRIAIFGHAWANGAAAGGFVWNLALALSTFSRNVGARLQIL